MNLVEGLASRGHEVTLYATGDSQAPARVRSVFPTAAWPPNTYREIVHAAAAAYDVLSRDGIDVIHAHVASLLAFARILDVPIVYTVHHDRDEALCDLYRATHGYPITMVAISARQRDLISDICEARVVHHGVSPSLYPLGPGNGGYVAFLGRFAPEKGVHVAIDVARRARLPIRLAGKSHDDRYFGAEVGPRLRDPLVRWVGEVSHAPKVRLLGDAVATLFPINWEEPFGLVMIESMLCGTPVLSFPRGSAPEVIDEGITGWLVDSEVQMAEKLVHLASGKERFDRARCRRFAARRFSADRMVDEYLAVYNEALGIPHHVPQVDR
ncbi:MAG: glycosyltransferase family 4 protein [Deltaproteobacteria bacterium]|nr:glycosyltransferase family 4 protein [Deltaproteobacteria bacterium]